MTKLTFTDYEMPSASMGKLNPLPDLKMVVDAHANIPIDEATVSREEAKYMGWGRINGILPYLIQNSYDRKKKMKSWKAAVLENDHIKATFLPELGGRLWSLIDKATGKELLHRNPVFQPCNLALRNAWISGGVEWNVGIIGHTPFTVDSMFVEELEMEDGTPVLRLYQYERIRKLMYRVEAMLPEDSKYLMVRVRIDNALDEDTAVYWWSNIAVDEGEDVRVLVPSDKSYRWGYGGDLRKISIPYMDFGEDDDKTEIDISRTTEIPQAMDFFFDVEKGQRPWISSVGEDGYGFIQASTEELMGRKLFVWGMGRGGRNWQTYLAQEGEAYIELQAGLAKTQLEHLPMKANESISWLEAYGPIQADPELTHGKDWDLASKAVDRAIEESCPISELETFHQRIKDEVDGKKGEIKGVGEAWALVDKVLYGDRFNDGGLNFPEDSLGFREEPWIELAEGKGLDSLDVLEDPTGYQIGSEWLELLKTSIDKGDSNHWYGYYQYGVILAHKGRMEEAEEAFDKSIALDKNPWALRNRGLLRELVGDNETAADYMMEAVEMLHEPNLVIEALQILLKANRASDVVSLYEELPEDVRDLGRIKVQLIEAFLDEGHIDKAEELLNQEIELTDVREGEVKLSDLWYRMMALKISSSTGREIDDNLLEEIKRDYTPPIHLDFRMH